MKVGRSPPQSTPSTPIIQNISALDSEQQGSLASQNVTLRSRRPRLDSSPDMNEPQPDGVTLEMVMNMLTTMKEQQESTFSKLSAEMSDLKDKVHQIQTSNSEI